MTETQRAYKDTVFRRLFGDPANRDALLSLYNALNGTDCTDPAELEINTIEEAVYIGLKNDISCIIDCRMALFEHQSTYNPNMPLRGLMYFAKLYSQFIETKRKNLYTSAQVKIPTPRYFVLYNGKRDAADKTILRLSDAFAVPDESGDFQWTAEMININWGHNQKLMDSCRLLSEYAQFVDCVEAYQRKGYDINEAVKLAVDDCIRNNILKDFLLKNKSEVIEMYILEYDAQRTMDIVYEDGVEVGREEGIKIGIGQGIEIGKEEGIELGVEKERIANLRNLMDALCISLDEAMLILKIPASEKAQYL